MGFIILQVQISEIAGYDEDVVFVVVLDESEFSRHMPLVIETCTLGRIVNVTKVSELDMLPAPWMMVRALHLLSRLGNAATLSEDVGSSLTKGGATAPEDSQDEEIDGPILVRESMKLGPFQTEIIEGKINLY